MMTKAIAVLVEDAMRLLKELGLKEGTLDSYVTRAFRPVIRFYETKGITEYQEHLMLQEKAVYQEQCKAGCISKGTLNWRLRGINILAEIHGTGSFEWKVFSQKEPVTLPDSLQYMVIDFISTLDLSDKRKQHIESIIRRFVIFISDKGLSDLSAITPIQVRDFMLKISSDRPKSMDDVVDALRKFFRYLDERIGINSSIYIILTAPRSRDHRIKPCMKTNEVSQMLLKIDRAVPKGKRDFAVLTLAATTGLRAGDLANLKLTDVVWRKRELHFIQGKTQAMLMLPLQKNVMNALADYILHGRPPSDSEYLFLRSVAPYHHFHDGVSISCIFRKYLSEAGIRHLPSDGRTLHGIRRMIGTHMITSGTPVTTVAQILGHRGIKATKRYISLDVEGLRKCALSMTSLVGC